jgi:hypothetical protein
VVSLELEEGRITTTGGLTSVFVVTVLLLTLGSAGVVETVLSVCVVVWHHALPARPTVTPIAATDTHKLKAFISSILLSVKCSSRASGTRASCDSQVAPDVINSDILSVHRYPVPGQRSDSAS